MNKNIMVLLAFLVLTSGNVNAQVVEYGDKIISALRIDQGGVAIQFTPPLANCNGGTKYRMHARLHKSNPNYNALLSALLIMKATESPVRYLWLGNEGITCSASEILTLKTFEY